MSKPHTMSSVANLEVKDFRLVHALFSEKTTGRAARSLGLTQSAVSHQLRNLEERLGLEVFARRGRGLVMTEVGARILSHSKDILTQIRQLESDLSRGRFEAKRELRIATQCYTAYHWLPGAMRSLEDEHPDVQLRIVPPATASPRIALNDGALDLAFCIGAEKDANLCQKRLFSDELVVLVSPENPLSQLCSVLGEDLQDEQLFLGEVGERERTMVHRRLFPQGGSFRGVTRIPLTEAIVEMVRANLGVSIMASWVVEPHVTRGELVAVRIGKKGLIRKWVATYPRSSDLVQPIRTLLRALTESGGPKPR